MFDSYEVPFTAMSSEYISCPVIATQHIFKTFEDAYNKIHGHPQYDVHYPRLVPVHTWPQADFDRFLDEVAEDLAEEAMCEEVKTDFGYCNCPTCRSVEALVGDLDHQIHRPDDDFAEVDCEEYEIEDEVPACGGCLGCCECLGDPPISYL